jgi:2-dehydro-3-deoxyphosphogluconate aldolase/(4S)-4-hydroxy-2-oxoglutarate aldolase
VRADELLEELRGRRVLAVVRAGSLPDPAGLAAVLLEEGVTVLELTTTTPGWEEALARTADMPGLLVGVGTVLDGATARRAGQLGARFVVSPAVVPELAGPMLPPVLMGAMTPTEVLTAQRAGAAAVKVFPAGRFGPGYLRDLRGPLPGVPLVPSGGIEPGEVAAYRESGALAVSLGSSLVPPAAVEQRVYDEVRAAARRLDSLR